MDRNVVLIVLDSVRKDYFDEFAPKLNTFADVSFDRCFSASSWTVPSHGSMFTGELAHRHGVYAKNHDYSHLKRSDTFLNELQEHRSIGVTSNWLISPAFGFDNFFHEYDTTNPLEFLPGRGFDLEKFADLLNGIIEKTTNQLPWLSFPKLFDYASRDIVRKTSAMRERTDEPHFLFTNFMEAHAPFRPSRLYDRSLYSSPFYWSPPEKDLWQATDTTEKGVEWYRDLYSAPIDYLDDVVIGFVSDLVEESERETTVIVTSDHGMHLGYDCDEGGLLANIMGVSTNLLDVPLLLFNPPEELTLDGSEFMSHLDLGNLIVGIANEEDYEPDREIAPADRIGTHGPPPELMEYRDRVFRCVHTADGEKYEWDSARNRKRFRYETSKQELVEEDIEIPTEFLDLYEQSIAEFLENLDHGKGVDDMSETTVEQLEDLGYL